MFYECIFHFITYLFIRTYPLNNTSKGSIEGARFAKLQARQFKGGLPVFTINRDITINKPQQDELWVEFMAGSPIIYIYHDGTKYAC